MKRKIITATCVTMNLLLLLGAMSNTAKASGHNNGGQALYVQEEKLINENEVYDILLSQQTVFPEGMTWTDNDYYIGKFGIYTGGSGCAAFAFYLSDAAFGDTEVVMHNDYSDLKVGDILRVYNDTHSVVILEIGQDSVIVAEGNYNSSIHWGREMSMSDIIDSKSYIMTRY